MNKPVEEVRIMAKYHINKDGVPSVCKAQTRPCPLGGDDIHFNTKQEAQNYADKKAQKQYGVISEVPAYVKVPSSFSDKELRTFLSTKPDSIEDAHEVPIDKFTRTISKYPKGTWLVIENQETGLSDFYVKTSENNWSTPYGLSENTEEWPKNDESLSQVLTRNKDSIGKIATAVDTSKFPFFRYKVEHMENGSLTTEISEAFDSYFEAGQALRANTKDLDIQKWYVLDSKGKPFRQGVGKITKMIL